jgi:hypothetical protein
VQRQQQASHAHGHHTGTGDSQFECQRRKCFALRSTYIDDSIAAYLRMKAHSQGFVQS